MKVISLTFLLIVSLAVIFGCVTTPRRADLPESLSSTAAKYWEMRMNDKYEETYEMEERDGLLPPYPEYIIKAKAIKKIEIRSHSIREVSQEGETGRVDVEFRFALPFTSKPFTQVIGDEWVYKNGRWRHIFQ